NAVHLTGAPAACRVPICVCDEMIWIATLPAARAAGPPPPASSWRFCWPSFCRNESPYVWFMSRHQDSTTLFERGSVMLIEPFHFELSRSVHLVGTSLPLTRSVL